MKILITGATGFVGRHVLGALSSQGHRLGLLVRSGANAASLKTAQTEFLEADLDVFDRSRSLIEKFAPEICVHLAWEGIPDYSASVSKRNLDRSIVLSDLLLGRTPCKKILVAGTCFEYGKTAGECVETDRLETASYIGWTKQALYSYLTLACAKASADLVWFRLFYVYGPGQRQDSLIPSIVNSIMGGHVPDVRTPADANDFIHVQDVARAFALAAKPQVRGGVYNLGSAQTTPVLEICRMIEREFPDRKGFVQPLEARPTPANPVRFWANRQRAKEELGWQPEIALSAGIQGTVRSMLQSR